jgi:hypothetical protein
MRGIRLDADPDAGEQFQLQIAGKGGRPSGLLDEAGNVRNKKL